MEYHTTLARLPEHLVFPGELQDRILFDKARNRLSFRGFMSRSTCDILLELSREAAYREAIERLFVLSAAELESSSPPNRSWAPWLLAGTAALLLVFAVVAWNRPPATQPPGWEKDRITDIEPPDSQTPDETPGPDAKTG